jgi:hypothetical protein
MGCQKQIAAANMDGGGNNVLTTKDNEPTLPANWVHFSSPYLRSAARTCRTE